MKTGRTIVVYPVYSRGGRLVPLDDPFDQQTAKLVAKLIGGTMRPMRVRPWAEHEHPRVPVQVAVAEHDRLRARWLDAMTGTAAEEQKARADYEAHLAA